VLHCQLGNLSTRMRFDVRTGQSPMPEVISRESLLLTARLSLDGRAPGTPAPESRCSLARELMADRA
jgi:hypothetical protein